MLFRSGLLNAIFGSIFMSAIAVLIGTPVGIAAGTYLSEYARESKLGFCIRFINDILLSTPSIVTMDNEEAYIVVGENVPFVTGSVSTSNGTVNPYTTIERWSHLFEQLKAYL